MTGGWSGPSGARSAGSQPAVGAWSGRRRLHLAWGGRRLCVAKLWVSAHPRGGGAERGPGVALPVSHPAALGLMDPRARAVSGPSIWTW